MEKQIINKEKKVKKPKPPGHRACVLTLVLQIIVVLVLGCIAFLPALSAFFAALIGLCAGLAVVISSVFTLGVIWIAEEVRTFWSNAFNWIEQIWNSPKLIVDSLKNSIVVISVVMFLVSLSGFIVNLTFFIKHRKNLGLFITSCIFLGLGLFNMIFAMTIYLNWN